VFQIRIHGRGGQGVVSAAEMLSMAAFEEGKHAQAVPSFGSERMGAPVVSFCRIQSGPIRSREPVVAPDCVVVQDPTLLHHVDVFQGLSKKGYVLINSTRDFEGLGLSELVLELPPGHCHVIPATELARQHAGRPVPNVPLIAAFAAATGIVHLDSVIAAIREKFRGKIGEGNVAAASAAHAIVVRRKESVHVEAN
jgi:pyruvate ferredoxin oxidoreductase gamma subunit